MVGGERRQSVEIGQRQRVRVAVLPRPVWLARPALLALILLFATALLGATHIARGDQVATVAPDSGTLATTFTFSVSGMTPGHGIEITVLDGAGNRFTYQQNGVPQALIVGPDGTTAVSLVPGRDLPGAVPGNWTANFTEEETGYVASIPFTVTAQ